MNAGNNQDVEAAAKEDSFSPSPSSSISSTSIDSDQADLVLVRTTQLNPIDDEMVSLSSRKSSTQFKNVSPALVPRQSRSESIWEVNIKPRLVNSQNSGFNVSNASARSVISFSRPPQATSSNLSNSGLADLNASALKLSEISLSSSRELALASKNGSTPSLTNNLQKPKILTQSDFKIIANDDQLDEFRSLVIHSFDKVFIS
jgi:hypothetical protein